jgi:hypothetical protein
MSTFQGLWDTATPVVKLMLNTFGGNTAPTKDAATTALLGPIAPLTPCWAEPVAGSWSLVRGSRSPGAWRPASFRECSNAYINL